MTAARAPRIPGEVSDVIADLRERIASMEGAQARRAGCLPFGVPEIDAALPGGGLTYGALHEFAGGGSGTVDGAAAALCVAGIAARTKGPVVWCLTRPDLFFPALAQVGLHPDRVIFVESDREEDVLANMEEGLSFGGLGAVVGVNANDACHAQLQISFTEWVVPVADESINRAAGTSLKTRSFEYGPADQHGRLRKSR